MRRLGWIPWVLAILAAVPLVGVVLGAIAILLALRTSAPARWAVVGLALVGMLTTAIPTARYIWYRASDSFEADVHAVVRGNTEWLVAAVERYRLETGVYPRALADLGGSDDLRVRLFDPIHVDAPGFGQMIHYERIGDESYVLLSRAPDGIPFTDDDIIPRSLPNAPGLRSRRP